MMDTRATSLESHAVCSASATVFRSLCHSRHARLRFTHRSERNSLSASASACCRVIKRAALKRLQFRRREGLLLVPLRAMFSAVVPKNGMFIVDRTDGTNLFSVRFLPG